MKTRRFPFVDGLTRQTASIAATAQAHRVTGVQINIRAIFWTCGWPYADRRPRAWLELGALLLLLVGCSAGMVSIRSASAPEQPYRRLMVAAPLTNPEARSEIEAAFVNVFVAEGVATTPSAVLFPPNRLSASDELLRRSRESGAQALLVIEVPDVFPLEQGWSELLAGSGPRDPTRASSGADSQSRAAGYAPHSGLLRFDLHLIDLDTGRTVWSAKTNTPLSGYPLSGLDRTYRWVARTSVTRLRRDGVVR